MSIEFSFTLLTTLVGVGVSVLLAAIPWAYSIHGRLTKIETSLHDHLLRLEALDDLERRLARLEFRVLGEPQRPTSCDY